jgi:hypothetical protein
LHAVLRRDMSRCVQKGHATLCSEGVRIQAVFLLVASEFRVRTREARTSKTMDITALWDGGRVTVAL